MSQLFSMKGIEDIVPPKTVKDVRPKQAREEQGLEANADSESFGQVLEGVDNKEAPQASQSVEDVESLARKNIKEDQKKEVPLETVENTTTVENAFLVAPFQILVETSGNEAIQSETIKLEKAPAISGEIVIQTGNGKQFDKRGPVENSMPKAVETPISNIAMKEGEKNISQEKEMTPFEGSHMKGLDPQVSKAKIPIEAMHSNARDSEEMMEIAPPRDADEITAAMKGNTALTKGETRSKSVNESSVNLKGEAPVLDQENEFTGSDTEFEDGAGQREGLSSSQLAVKTSISDISTIQESSPLRQLENPTDFNLSDKDAIVSQVTEQFKGLQAAGIEKVRFQLEPKTLGSLQIEISVQKGGVAAHIVTGDFYVKELLEGNLALLRQNLAEQGLQIDKFSVDVGEMEASFYDKRDNKAFLKHHHPFPEVGRSDAAHLEPSQLAKGLGLINLYV